MAIVATSSETQLYKNAQGELSENLICSSTAGLDFNNCNRTNYFRVLWNVAIEPNPEIELEPYTTTHGHFPPLAQDVEDIPNLKPTFRDPLRHLNLDLIESKEQRLSESTPISENTTSPKRERRQSTFYFARGGRNPKGFLRTPPNKYLPVPPLVRSAYYYSFGRCPVCAGNIPLINPHGKESAGSGHGAKKGDRRPVRCVKNWTRNGPLDHLEGKTQVHTDNDTRRSSLTHLRSYVFDLLSVMLELRSEQDSLMDDVRAIQEDQQLKSPSPSYQVDLFEDDGSLATFASAGQLNTITKKNSAINLPTKRHLRLDSQRFTPRYQLKTRVDDLKTFFPGRMILEAKLKDYDCHLPLISTNTEIMRELYKVTIIQDHVLSRLYHQRNFRNLPPDLQYLRKYIGLDIMEAVAFKVKDAEMDRDHQFFIRTGDYSKSILAEIANHFYEADFICLGVFTSWFKSAKADKSLLQLKTPKEMSRLCQLLGEELFRSNYSLGGTARMELLIVLATAINEPKMRHQMWVHARQWLEPLIGGLFSRSKSVREESCYTLAYIFSINTLVDDIRHLMSYDIPYDVTWNVLKAIDRFPETFMTYFVLLGYMIEGCPSISILNCLMERGPLCRNKNMQKRWPLFIYYAIKHWDAVYLCVDVIYPTILMEKMTNTAMKPLTRKPAKLALVALAKKFDKPVGAVTHFNSNWLQSEGSLAD
ncbi:unnamed protein product [Mesocestoides corti]|uniref:Uncharacterized protein n=1 Tax=Mesocestoides corti TaxID=53468 RepID=A0A0R3UG61_MESCO|nr:unnamed protein product [Mesocestoides corti]